jgi:hypothetical protein
MLTVVLDAAASAGSTVTLTGPLTAVPHVVVTVTVAFAQPVSGSENSTRCLSGDASSHSTSAAASGPPPQLTTATNASYRAANGRPTWSRTRTSKPPRPAARIPTAPATGSTHRDGSR